MSIGLPSILIFILFIALLCGESASGNPSIAVVNSGLSLPFESTTNYIISSPFGYRKDPLSSNERDFHKGIDLATSEGTNIVSSADGVIHQTGYNDSLGNYIYVKHETNIGTIYTGYAHILDNSIIVTKDEKVVKGQVIGQVGSTGKSTGPHLHFFIMKNKISLEKDDLIDPSYVISGLK